MKLSENSNLGIRIGFLFVLTVAISPVAHGSVATYDINAVIYEPAAAYNTFFNGSFDWDGATVSNLHGTMNSSMYDTNDINPDYYNSFPLMQLNYQLGQSIDGNLVTASVFLENSTDVFQGGGYKTGDGIYYGYQDGFTRNWNAYFSFTFDMSSMQGIVDNLVYADCTKGGMMGPLCMTGHNLPERGTMGASPLSLNITEVAAVPVPTAVWLFGSVLMGLIGINRKRVVTV
ncbi:hypothetical protein [Methylomonas methanica]|uniref:Uncharacterized protein n=1 Tax=Methylomonas methanica (strain DSM 25384 / MC09) TaxID=857087 RepID=G0A234_METMM|nr:hypothetical protein [Methylomonas methanica]AEG02577.1 hypothetical protein Metme_4226 [Methylomonas methanica MC09]